MKTFYWLVITGGPYQFHNNCPRLVHIHIDHTNYTHLHTALCTHTHKDPAHVVSQELIIGTFISRRPSHTPTHTAAYTTHIHIPTQALTKRTPHRYSHMVSKRYSHFTYIPTHCYEHTLHAHIQPSLNIPSLPKTLHTSSEKDS